MRRKKVKRKRLYIMDEYIIYFTEQEAIVLNDLARQITIIPSECPEDFCRQVKRATPQIPERIREQLQLFSQKGTKAGFLLFRGISVDSIQTPADNNQKIGETTLLARIQSLLISSISEMISYEAEGYGRLFQDIVPIESMTKKQTSVGSNIELEIHTEQAFSKLRPDILSLACLKGDLAAQTYILPVKIILDHMTEEEKQLLRNPLWKTGVDLSFKLHGKEFAEGEIRGPMPIIRGSDIDPMLNFDQDLMFAHDNYGVHLITKIVAIYYEKRLQHNLSPGEIILIDNRRAVHGRSPFFPKYDGTDRFLIRCFSTFDYEKSAYARKGRMVNAIYS